MWYEGELMLGGCGKSFSRQDALKRHVDHSERCGTDHDGPWLLGNRGNVGAGKPSRAQKVRKLKATRR
ncbi:hypothetical protein C8Q80DRAFT_1133453 [Daedaleopsis nitida]|nr:hypothetical protein C8Q80DRAFT_1133453 [Daedaleopsis nitida]